MGVHIKVADIRHISATDMRGFDATVDLAGISNDASCDLDPSITSSINVAGGNNLLSASLQGGVRRYVYSSSASVYGCSGRTPMTEGSETIPLTAYAKAKLEMERSISTIPARDMETVILRNATVYGVAPRMRFDLAINRMAMSVWRDDEIKIEGGGKQMRPFIHIKDLVRAIQIAVEAPTQSVAGELFNIGAENVSIEDAALAVMRRLPKGRFTFVDGSIDERTYIMDGSKFAERFEFRPCFTIGDGAREVFDACYDGMIDIDDPRTITLRWYSDLIAWSKRISDLGQAGPIL